MARIDTCNLYHTGRIKGLRVGPFSIGSGETAKEGRENTYVLMNQLEQADLTELSDGTPVRLTLMIVDQAGGKTAATLYLYGLIFVIWCDMHCISLVSEQQKVAFGAVSQGTDHGTQLPPSVTCTGIGLLCMHCDVYVMHLRHSMVL